MRKSLVMTAFLVSACVFFAGCKSTAVSLAGRSPIAVATVLGNPSVPWLNDENTMDDDDDGSGGALSTMINKRMNGSNPEYQTATDRVEYAKDSLLQFLPENGGVEVVDPDVLLAAASYKDASEGFLNVLDTSLSADGYKNLMQLGAKPARLILNEVGAASMMLTEFTFRKALVSGGRTRGMVAAHVTMKVRYLDENGKEKLNREYVSVSATAVPMTSGKYDKDALVDLFPETIDTVINQFIVTNL